MGLRNKVRCLLIEARIKGDCCHSEAPWQTARMGVMKGPKLHRKTRYTRAGTLRKEASKEAEAGARSPGAPSFAERRVGEQYLQPDHRKRRKAPSCTGTCLSGR